MAWHDLITSGRNYVSVQSELEVGENPLRRKDYDYSRDNPAYQFQYAGEFAIPPIAVTWTDPKSYQIKARRLLQDCPVSKACIQMRADAIASVALKISGNPDAKNVLTVPNFRDRTMSAALRSWETQLAIGGKLYLFFNMKVPGRTTIESLRQDLVVNNVKSQRFEYTPGAMAGGTKPLFMFDYDASGKVTTAWELAGSTYRSFPGALQQISYYDPLDSAGGLPPGDAALRSVDVWLAAENLIQRKFNAGGVSAGFIRAPLVRSEAEAAKLKSMVAAIKPDGGQTLLANGMDFQAAQLTFAELQLSELRDKAADAICTAFCVNSTMVNVGAATHANLRGMDKIFYRNFAGPEANWLVGQLEWGVRTYVSPNATIEVDETGIQHIQDDIRDNAVALAPLGVLTIDEVRDMIGKPPLPDGQGKALCAGKPAADQHTGLGQPEEKPGGETEFNADAGARGDNNDGQ